MKTALITGASRGIGAACARALASDGWRVVINYNTSADEAEKLARETGGIAIQADVSDMTQVENMFSVSGNVDLLVCNAGIALQKLVTDTSRSEWDRIFSVNVTGVFNCCKAALPHMIRNHAGKIITVSSMWGITGASCECAYSASKAAVIGFTKALAKEVGPSNIQVNCIAPGVIDTDMNSALSPETIEELCDETPLTRIGTPEDIAALAVFLASEKADFITGQVISSNGGFLI